MIKIAFPSTSKNDGPKIFLRRLKKVFLKKNMAKISHFINPFHDIGLYSSVSRSIFMKPYVLRVDGIYFDSKETSGPNSERNKPIFDSITNAAGIIFQSNYSKQLIESFYGKIDKPFAIINNGVKINYDEISFRSELGVPDKKIILCASKWRKHKRLDIIARLIEKLNRVQNKFHLIVLGANAEEFIRPGTPNITIAGDIAPENLYKYYKSADIYIHIPWIDNCPNTLVEAIGNNLPSITSNLGGSRELIEKTNGGLVTECDQPIKIGKFVDLYHPPKPNIETIIKDVLHLSSNLESYKKQVNHKAVDIEVIANQYLSFIKDVYSSLR